MPLRDLIPALGPERGNGLVLCRPKGGLNDMLNQIEKCWAYAEAERRHLLVDTQRSGFLDDFARYFVPRRQQPVTFGAFDAARWPGSVLPAALAGRVDSYEPAWRSPPGLFADAQSGTALTFDFSRRHAEQVLVHEQCGGGLLSVRALRRMVMTPAVAGQVASRLAGLGDYAAIHVRNTDFQTDYRTLFDEVARQVPAGRLVLCTDDRQCQLHAQGFFGERVVMSSRIPDTGGRRLHLNRRLDRWATNVDAIADLCVLALGRQLFVSRHASGALSGYAQLARELAARRDIVAGLIGTPP